MTNTSPITIAVITALLSVAPQVYADEGEKTEAQTVEQALKDTDVQWTFRYRAEYVDQDNILNDASASTLLTRISLNTASFNDFSFKFEADNVSAVSHRDDYNSKLNGHIDHSVVADPEATEINQAAVKYTGLSDTSFTLGRQRINLGNQRFVGGVGWRQNEQTYDGVLINNSSIENGKITYAYVNNINTILDSNRDTRSHFINYDWSLSDNIGLNFYGYLLDFQQSPLDSTQTLGARLNVSSIADSPAFFNAEYAKQEDYEENPKQLDTDYMLGEIGYRFNNWAVSVGQEILTGDANRSGYAFQTPLATKHKFQGWADQFLITPDAGIEDSFVNLKATFNQSSFTVQYHIFDAEDTNQGYGKELGLSYKLPLNKNVSMVAKLADYQADSFSVDTRKAWLMFVAKF
ncbi:alginate export family protein [Kangiella shandongensis]|uniref:alginate export family protein n=1 Tax=Kangiella shandongensis TaxID=2763258 RepID=UPI001CBDA7AE|nr:alginate export family protein [Kangiella shandongensis]